MSIKHRERERERENKNTADLILEIQFIALLCLEHRLKMRFLYTDI
jgi:hypothetical protein